MYVRVMYVCMYVCVRVCMCLYVCMYVRMYICMYVCMYEFQFIKLHILDTSIRQYIIPGHTGPALFPSNSAGRNATIRKARNANIKLQPTHTATRQF